MFEKPDRAGMKDRDRSKTKDSISEKRPPILNAKQVYRNKRRSQTSVIPPS
jgi:hypothetical protein